MSNCTPAVPSVFCAALLFQSNWRNAQPSSGCPRSPCSIAMASMARSVFPSPDANRACGRSSAPISRWKTARCFPCWSKAGSVTKIFVPSSPRRICGARKEAASFATRKLEEFSAGLIALFSEEMSEPNPGSARVSRAGGGVPPSRTFLKSARKESSLRRDAATSTRDACATQAGDRVRRLLEIFGRERVYVELQRHLVRGEERRNRRLIDLAAQHRLPLLATNGVQHATPLGREVLDVFTCIREHTHLDAAGTRLTNNTERHLKSAAEMKALFRDLPEAIANTVRLAERLEFSLENIGYHFPDYSVPEGHSMDTFLRTLVLFGAQQRYESISHQSETPARVRARPHHPSSGSPAIF